jgi:hypothetical protein
VLNRKTPSANVPAKSTPIAVSARIAARLLTQPIASAVVTAAIPAPIRNGPLKM